MKERPIIFSGPMVRAILEGRKTQTRRVASPSNSEFGSASREYWEHCAFKRAWIDGAPESGQYLHVPCHRGDDKSLETAKPGWQAAYPDRGECRLCDEMGWRTTCHRLWPRWEVGSRLWVRETFHDPGAEDYHLRELKEGLITLQDIGVTYRADGGPRPCIGGWSPSIHMPRWASRITLEIKSIRVERLQDISEEDALCEGLTMLSKDQGRTYKFGLADWDGLPGNDLDGWYWADWHTNAKSAFQRLWESINGPGSWDANPWVWVVEFERTQDTGHRRQ